MIPGFLLMSIAPILSWQTNKIQNSKKYVLGFILLSVLVLIQSYFLDFNTWGFVGLLLGFWIILASTIAIFSSYKVKFTIKFKGRELQHSHLGNELMGKIKEDMKDIGKVELHPKFDGKQMIMVIQPL